jgi:hypothetical protein
MKKRRPMMRMEMVVSFLVSEFMSTESGRGLTHEANVISFLCFNPILGTFFCSDMYFPFFACVTKQPLLSFASAKESSKPPERTVRYGRGKGQPLMTNARAFSRRCQYTRFRNRYKHCQANPLGIESSTAFVHAAVQVVQPEVFERVIY